MNQDILPDITVPATSSENSNPIASSSNAIGTSSSKTIASSSIPSKSNAKSRSNANSASTPPVSTRHSARMANSQQNRPNVNTDKQPSNLPALPEEDIAVITDFTNDTPHPPNPRKHVRTSQNAAGQSPPKKKGRKGKGKAADAPLNVDSVEALLDAPHGHNLNPPPTLPSVNPLGDSPPSPSGNASGSAPPLPESLGSLSSSNELFTFTQAELEAIIAEHADKLANESRPLLEPGKSCYLPPPPFLALLLLSILRLFSPSIRCLVFLQALRLSYRLYTLPRPSSLALAAYNSYRLYALPRPSGLALAAYDSYRLYAQLSGHALAAYDCATFFQPLRRCPLFHHAPFTFHLRMKLILIPHHSLAFVASPPSTLRRHQPIHAVPTDDVWGQLDPNEVIIPTRIIRIL
ncbi:hypothetical protein BDZ94DRAFT_1310090 [Collybia nuda]|uniref:Uncharacterized protein n=1 Tax=Collybia nuda TaxID=64659 RepID=A0A9P5Y2I0_9AGAR|nr:hypothetical protein BDZ94DRAFT_1310090 [Collybia nuda]